MFSRLLRFFNSNTPQDPQPTEAIATARQWQMRLRWLAWLLPVIISVLTYALVWYRLLRSGQSSPDLQQASNIIFASALGAMVLGIFIYQIQIILAQQVATSAELERRVEERTRNIKQVMQQLDEQNQALRALDQQKSEFVTLVSHELRAPLTNINGGLEVLLSRDLELSARSRETLTLVAAEAARLTRFVETILNVSAIESGQIPIMLGPVAMDGVIRHVVGQFSNLPPDRVVVAVPNDLPLVLSDDLYLQSVLFHLLDNAFKYAPDGSVWITVVTRDDSVDVRVTDSGPGVSPEAASRLFRMFERLDARDSQFVYGYGLGLYMCKQLMKAVHGDIWLDTEMSPGASFVMTVPQWTEPAEIPQN